MCDVRVDYASLPYPRPGGHGYALPRRALVGLVGLLACGMLAIGFAHVALGNASTANETVIVQPGDTLWAIAAKRFPNADARDKIEEIERVNGLRGPLIHPGQSLRIPSG